MLNHQQRFLLAVCHYLCAYTPRVSVDYVRDQFIKYFARVYNQDPDLDMFCADTDLLAKHGYFDKFGSVLCGFTPTRRDMAKRVLTREDFDDFGEWFLFCKA